MRRRDLLFGLGGVASGSSLIVGSSGFTTVEAERDFDVNIVDEDEEALGAMVTEDRWTVTTYDIDASIEGVFGSEYVAEIGEDEGIAHINNSLPGEVVALLKASAEHVYCRPCDEEGDTVTVNGGDQANFKALVDCSQSAEIEGIVDIIARINPDNDQALSADIDGDVELDVDTYITVDLDPNSGRVRLATDREQHGEHLNIDLPLSISPVWCEDGETGIDDGKEVTIEDVSGFDYEALVSDSEYDALHKLELSDSTGAEYEIENWLTYHSDESGSDWWEHHGTSEVQEV